MKPLRVPRSLLARVARAGEAAYPREGCGALLGADGADGGRALVGEMALENRDAARHRYRADPDDVRRVEAAAARRGLEMVGVWHSHPDAPARPSETDRALAWPWYTYLIVAVEGGRAAGLGAWRLADDRASFLPVPIEETDA